MYVFTIKKHVNYSLSLVKMYKLDYYILTVCTQQKIVQSSQHFFPALFRLCLQEAL